jgi:aerobic-type carbon monoxide dehydrogenase small subunit (CoxS/CutS family)
MTLNSDPLRLQKGISRGTAFEITVDDHPLTAYPGEMLSTVLLAAGQKTFRFSQTLGEPRGLYCGMGVCFDCLVTVNGRANVRACVTLAQPNDKVDIQHGS